MKSQILHFKYFLFTFFIVILNGQPKLSIDLGSGFYEPTMKGFDDNALVSFPTGNILTRNLLINFSTFYETAVTVGRNGFTCGSHAVYVCQGCQTSCLSRTGPIQWRLTYSFAAVFTDLSLRPSTIPTGSVASFDNDLWT